MVSIPASDERARAVVDAIQRGDVEALRRRLDESAELAGARIVDSCGVARTLLHVAADWPGHIPNGASIVACLVAAGADVNARLTHTAPGGHAETALHWAASSDDVEVLDALLDAGADIEAPGAVFTRGTPMSDAVVFAQWRAARRLLERGAATTVWQAAALGLLDRVQELCADDPPADQLTNAFWHACRGGQQEAAAYLLARGADLNWIGYEDKTPLDVAREHADGGLAEWLAAQGARGTRELT